MNAIVTVTFKGGTGNVTAKLFSMGAEIDKGTLNQSGSVTLKNIHSGDAISLNGVATGSEADVNIDVLTFPVTPEIFPEGPIIASYDVQ